MGITGKDIYGFYYSSAPIGVTGGGQKTNVYDPYFKQIHHRDMNILQGAVNTIRISSLGTSTSTTNFLDIVYAANISVIAGFGLQPYVFNKPSELQQQLDQLHTDFTKFVQHHMSHPAISMWSLGDVGDYLFTPETSVSEYP